MAQLTLTLVSPNGGNLEVTQEQMNWIFKVKEKLASDSTFAAEFKSDRIAAVKSLGVSAADADVIAAGGGN